MSCSTEGHAIKYLAPVLLLCATVHGAVVSGGPRTASLLDAPQTVMPSLPRNPYWFDLSHVFHGTKAVYTHETIDDDTVLAWNSTNFPYIGMGASVRGALQDFVFTLNEGAQSTVDGTNIVYGGDSSITVYGTSGGIVRSVDIDTSGDVSPTSYGFTGGSLFSNATYNATNLIAENGYTLDSRQTLVEDAGGQALEWYNPHADWQAAYPAYSNLFGVAGTRTLIRNANSVLGATDISGISVWNSILYNQMAGTLITKKHAVIANHWGADWIGETIGFIGMDGQYFETTVTNQAVVAGDLGIIRLSEEVPAYIAPLYVMPTNWTDYISINESGNYPYSANILAMCFFIDQMKIIHGTYYAGMTGISSTYDANYPDLGVNKDSGSPVFSVVDGNTVLHVCFNGPSGGASAPSAYINEINAQIATWGDTNTVNVLNMESLTRYRE